MKKNKKLTLSIVIPAYNEEDYLKSCLDSVMAQTIAPDEIIVVDNNSMDDTAEIAKAHKKTLILNEPIQGVFYASTHGFREASSDIIARIDADTVLPPDWVERLLKDFDDESVTATTGPVMYYDMPLPSRNYLFDHLMRKLTYKYSPDTPFLYGSNMAVRRRDWQKVSSELCTDRNIHEDIDLAIHLHLSGLKIKYNKLLLSGASGRRYNDGSRDFKDYIAMYKTSYHNHGLHGKAVLPAMFMWSLGYVLIHPWRSLWYGIHKRFSVYPQSAAVRKNPMAS